MVIEAWLEALHRTSGLESPEQAAAFDQALEHAAELATPADLPALFGVFRDDAGYEEVMFGLVHLVEDFEMDAFIAGFLASLPELALRAPEWARTFHFRIINSETARQRLKVQLAIQGKAARTASERILRDIMAKESAELAARAKAVLE